jgi:hypothetical protein
MYLVKDHTSSVTLIKEQEIHCYVANQPEHRNIPYRYYFDCTVGIGKTLHLKVVPTFDVPSWLDIRVL